MMIGDGADLQYIEDTFCPECEEGYCPIHGTDINEEELTNEQ